MGLSSGRLGRSKALSGILTAMRLVSWNINSLRMRLDLLRRLSLVTDVLEIPRRSSCPERVCVMLFGSIWDAVSWRRFGVPVGEI
jgi:hypothetical protein